MSKTNSNHRETRGTGTDWRAVFLLLYNEHAGYCKYCGRSYSRQEVAAGEHGPMKHTLDLPMPLWICPDVSRNELILLKERDAKLLAALDDGDWKEEID